MAPEPQALAQLARELSELGLTEALSAVALSAGRSLLAMRARQLAAGHKPCPACDVLHDGLLAPRTPLERALEGRDTSGYELPDRALCPACQRYARDAKVRAASRELAFDPGLPAPGLSGDERAVALRLAARYLDQMLASLLPQAISEPSLRPQLLRAARCRAAVAAGKPLSELVEADLGLLDARYRRFIGPDWTAEA